MTQRRSPIVAGLSAAFTHRRLAGVLWLGLLASSLPAWFAFGPLLAPLDEGPFRESLLRGWDSWAFLSFVGTYRSEVAVAFAALGASFVLSVLLDLLLTTGAVRVLLSGIPRPVLRRTVAEGAALFRPTAWAFARYLLSFAVWFGLLVVVPAILLGKISGKDAPPNGLLATLAVVWVVVAAAVVAANVNLRFSLSRIALARGDAANARGAYRSSRRVLRGARPGAIGVWLFWFLAGAALQALFTAIGIAMNPATSIGIGTLVVVRQAGFWLVATTRVGYQASLLAVEERRRPLPPLPLAHPVPPVPEPAPEPTAGPAPGTAPGAPEGA